MVRGSIKKLPNNKPALNTPKIINNWNKESKEIIDYYDELLLNEKLKADEILNNPTPKPVQFVLKTKQAHIFECNGFVCNESLTLVFDSFEEVCQRLREKYNWHVRDVGYYSYFCEDCGKEEKLKDLLL